MYRYYRIRKEVPTKLLNEVIAVLTIKETKSKNPIAKTIVKDNNLERKNSFIARSGFDFTLQIILSESCSSTKTVVAVKIKVTTLKIVDIIPVLKFLDFLIAV